MTIYGEYLFLENFITGILLLMLTGKFFGRRLRKIRVLVGGVFCGAAGFTIFCNWTALTGILVKALTGVVVIWITFGSRKPAEILKQTGVFVLLTFLSGGAAMAMLLWWKEPMLYGNGAVYMGEVTYFRLIVIGIVAFCGCYWAVHTIKERKIEKSLTGDVYIKIGDRELVLAGFLDSGNHLREPISGKPVILVDIEGQKALCKTDGEVAKPKNNIPPERLVVIPYRAIGTDSGSLKGIRCERVTFKNNSVNGAIVGLYNGKFNGYRALVGKDFIDGGEN